MQGIYTHIPETNYVPREHGVAAILLLLFMVLISLVPVLNILYFYISTFRSMCAVPNMAVFCNSLTSWFPGMLLTYLLNDWNSPSRHIVTGITFVFTLHVRCISTVRSIFKIFSAYYYYHHHHHHRRRRRRNCPFVGGGGANPQPTRNRIYGVAHTLSSVVTMGTKCD